MGLLAFAVSAALNAVPSVWYDEAASLSGALRSWPALLGLVDHVDAVHGLYYGLLHLWFDVVPYSPFALRLPSALAVGGCAALVVHVGGRLVDRRTGLTAGAFAAMLPALTWAGGEGRSFALTAFLATAATAVLLSALEADRHRVAHWLLYALLAAFAGALFLDALLLLPAHAVAVLLLTRGRPTGHASRIRFALAAALAIALVAPLVAVAATQRAQIAWVDPLDGRTVVGVLVNQWFTAAPPFAGLALVVLIGAAVTVVRRARRLDAPAQRTLAVAVPWALLPTAALLLVSAVAMPVYLPRYLTFTAPAVALLLGLVVARLPRRRATVLLVVFTLLAVPPLLGSRLPHAKQRSHYAAASAAFTQARQADAQDARVGVVFAPLAAHRTGTTSLVALAYPDAFGDTVDVTLRVPLERTDRLWEPRLPLADAADRLRGLDVVYAITDDAADPQPLGDVLAPSGFASTGSAVTGTLRITRYTR